MREAPELMAHRAALALATRWLRIGDDAQRSAQAEVGALARREAQMTQIHYQACMGMPLRR